MWVLANHYKDQYDDLEKYKMICRFVNPSAANKMWDTEIIDSENDSSIDKDFLVQIQKHTKTQLSSSELSDRLLNPSKYDTDLDTIERVS